jgi:hypothetical protein
LELKVAPQITSENTLELDIDVTRQTPTNAPTDPVQGSIKRQANTKLIVNNGETAVIGGLYQTQKFKGQGRIPFLGRLPIIGMLFRTNEEQSFRSELMVLITPRILPGGAGRASARTDLPIIGGSSGGGGGNNFNNDGGNSFSNSAGAGGGADGQSSTPLAGNTGGGSKEGGVTSANGGGGGGDNLGNADDFGVDSGGNAAPAPSAGGNAKAANGGGNGLNNLSGNNIGGANAKAGGNGGGNGLDNFDGGNTATNSAGGDGNGDLSNGGDAPPPSQGNSGGSNGLNNLGGNDL